MLHTEGNRCAERVRDMVWRIVNAKNFPEGQIWREWLSHFTVCPGSGRDDNLPAVVSKCPADPQINLVLHKSQVFADLSPCLNCASRMGHSHCQFASKCTMRGAWWKTAVNERASRVRICPTLGPVTHSSCTESGRICSFPWRDRSKIHHLSQLVHRRSVILFLCENSNLMLHLHIGLLLEIVRMVHSSWCFILFIVLVLPQIMIWKLVSEKRNCDF